LEEEFTKEQKKTLESTIQQLAKEKRLTKGKISQANEEKAALRKNMQQVLKQRIEKWQAKKIHQRTEEKGHQAKDEVLEAQVTI